MILEAVKQSIEQVCSNFSCSGEPLRLVVAVSGGEDSHVLLHSLRSLSEDYHFHLFVAHLDHGLRTESAREARFVSNLCERYGIPCSIKRAGALPTGENMEAWARKVRYAFLETARRETEAHFIVTAHHQSDQAETLLQRFLDSRMLNDTRSIASYDLRRKLLRPLLLVPKSEIEDYSTEQRLDFVVDESNFDSARTRSRLRNELLPQLAREYNPQIIPNTAALAERLNADENCLEDAARLQLKSILKPADLRNVPAALRWRLLRLSAELHLGRDARKVSYNAFQNLLSMLEDGATRTRALDLGFEVRALLVPGELPKFLNLEQAKAIKIDYEQPGSVPLSVPGFVERRYSDGSAASITAGVVVVKEELRNDLSRLLNWTKTRVSENDAESFAVEYFDLEQLPHSDLVVRERRDGDRIRVWRRGERKLKKLFLEHRLPGELRDNVPLVESGDGILWVPGVARGEIAPLGPDSRYLLELRYARR